MIGIVGGIGSYAGIDLIRKIYDLSPAQNDQEHLPINMLSIPYQVVDRTAFLLGEIEENPGFAIAEIINKLATNGCQLIGIPCNTAHAKPIFEVIEQNTPNELSILHMIEEVGKYLLQNFSGIKKIGLLATNGTITSRVYNHTLASIGVKVIQPSPDIQKNLVHPAVYDPIYGIKAQSNPVQAKARANLLEGAAYLKNQGIEALILGCTEIPLAIKEPHLWNIPVIDATEVLAQALIKHSLPFNK